MNNTRILFIAFLCFLGVGAHTQDTQESALICGSILFEEDSISPLKPYSIIIRKDWPINFKRYEQHKIDTSDYSFKFRMPLKQLTYGPIIINFIKEFDSTDISQNRFWFTPKISGSGFGTPYSARILFSGLSLLVEPGDSIHIVVNYNKEDQQGQPLVTYSGIGGANNMLNRSRGLFNPWSKNFRLPLEEGLNEEDLEMKEKLEKLNIAKDSISQAYFQLLKTDILFDNLKSKHALIRASLYDTLISIEDKRILARRYYSYMDTLTLRPEFVSSRYFRSFLSFYLEYLNRIISGKDLPFGFNEGSYSLAKAVFETDILKPFLYEQLAFQMEVPRFYLNHSFQYENFLKDFPGTPEAHSLSRIYNKHFPVTRGQPAPDLLLVDSLENSTHLSSLRGKVVLMSTHSAWSQWLSKEKNRLIIDQIKRKFGSRNLVLISFNDGFYAGRPFFSSYLDYYVPINLENSNFDKYLFLRSSQYMFLIGKQGNIETCASGLAIQEELISSLMLEKYNLLTRMVKGIQTHLREFVVALSLLLFISLILLLNSILKHRRQELKRRQLNSDLRAIRSQLNPHFLFNSLNSIQNFINKCDTKTANLHLSKFSKLMRWVIELSEKESISLKEELDFNQTFIELEQLRYGFTCTFDVEEGLDLYNTEIPSMIIQPFVENAIVHAMADLGEKGELTIGLKESGENKVCFEIKDNGRGFNANEKEGFGLKSSRERIDLINAQNREQITLQMHSKFNSKANNGTLIRLIIPRKL